MSRRLFSSRRLRLRYNPRMSNPISCTAAQAAAIDAYVTGTLGVDSRQLMEVAGLRAAEAAVKILGKKGKRVVVLAGPGGNGGDGLTCAKWLHLWGYDVHVVSSHPFERLRDVTAKLLETWKAFGGTCDVYPPQPGDVDLVVDSLFGYSLNEAPHGRAAELIEWANATGKPVLALDIPSGLNATTGEVYQPCVRATHTVVFGVMKRGLEIAAGHAGNVELADIGFPRSFPPAVLSA